MPGIVLDAGEPARNKAITTSPLGRVEKGIPAGGCPLMGTGCGQ